MEELSAVSDDQRMQAKRLGELIEQKRRRAELLDAIDEQSGDGAAVERSFLMAGPGLVSVATDIIRVSTREGFYPEVTWDRGAASGHVVDVRPDYALHAAGEPADSTLLHVLAQQMSAMEIAPSVRVPYGFFVGNVIVGVMFMNQREALRASSAEASTWLPGVDRGRMGISREMYLDPQANITYRLLYEPHPARWLEAFWSYRNEGIVQLSRVIGGVAVYSGVEDGRPWLEFEQRTNESSRADAGPVNPGFTLNTRYELWDTGYNKPASPLPNLADEPRHLLDQNFFR